MGRRQVPTRPDYIKWLLLAGAAALVVFMGWYVPKHLIKDEFTNGGTLRGRFFGFYFFMVRYVCPICILLIFLHQFNVI